MFDNFPSLQGQLGGVGYRIVPMHWRSDGAREHSRAQRSSLATRFDWDLPGQGTLTLSAQYFDAPDAQDPRALTDQEWRRDPHLAAPVATTFNTRKSVRQDQVGAFIHLPEARVLLAQVETVEIVTEQEPMLRAVLSEPLHEDVHRHEVDLGVGDRQLHPNHLDGNQSWGLVGAL